MSRDTVATVVSIGLIVIGILLIIGEFTIGWLLNYAGIALIVLGILVLLKTLPGGMLIGVVALVIGILMLKDIIPLPSNVRGATSHWSLFVNIIAGAVLVALGISRLGHSKAN